MAAKPKKTAKPKKAPKKAAAPQKPATPAPILATEASAPKGAPATAELTNEASGTQAAAVPTTGGYSVIAYVKPNGRLRRGSMVALGLNDVAHIRLEDGTELRGVARQRSADQTDCWKSA